MDTQKQNLWTWKRRNLTAVTVQHKDDITSRSIVLVSAYMPLDEETPPPQELQEMVRHCEKQKIDVIIATDSNAHHTLWGSPEDNKRDFSEHLRQLGCPRAVSLESFRSPNFPLLAELLVWLARRFDPEADVSGGADTLEERVALVRTAAKFMATKANIKLNLKRLYGADGYAVRELLKMTSVLCAALLTGAGAASGDGTQAQPPADRDADVDHLNYDVSSKIGEIKQARQLATEITAKGAVLYDILAKEPEYKEVRERAPARQLDMAQVEASLTRAAETVRARTAAARERADAAAAADRALLAKCDKRRGELERAEMRLLSIQKIKPVYQGELAALETELEALWEQYVLRHRCVEALKHQLSLVERAQAEVAEQQQAAVLQLIHKYEAEDVLGNVSDSDDMDSNDEQKNPPEQQREPRPTTRPKTRLRIKTAGRGGEEARRGVYGSMGGGGAGGARDELDDVPDEDDSRSDSDDLVSELARATSRYGRRSTMRAEESLLSRYSARAHARAPPAQPASRQPSADDDDDFGDLLEGGEEDGDSLGSSDESELQMGAGGAGPAAAVAGGAEAGAGSARAHRAPSTKPTSLHDILSDDEF